MNRSLIIGGTKGLGRELAVESLRRNIPTIVTGRSIHEAEADDALENADFARLDLTSPETFIRDLRCDWRDVTHVFWNAGVFLRKPLTDCTPQEIRLMTETHLTGPIAVLAAFHRLMKASRPLADEPGQPWHLVTVGSTSSWKVRDNEAVYCALKAAKTHLTRNFARELVRDLPGSKATLVNPGGIRTENFWGGSGQDISGFIEPAVLARLIWDETLAQTAPYAEFQVLRHPTAPGGYFVERGPHAPEMPF